MTELTNEAKRFMNLPEQDQIHAILAEETYMIDVEFTYYVTLDSDTRKFQLGFEKLEDAKEFYKETMEECKGDNSASISLTKIEVLDFNEILGE